MKPMKQFWTSIAAAAGLTVLILDSKTALTGAADGIRLCLYTVIPSLFPFIVISGILNRSLIGKKFKILQPICKICGIPTGAESLLMLGFLGGYPVGAQSINEACSCGALNTKDGKRMLGFCSNAGPAFIFGMLGGLFDSQWASWGLWAIHILSALIVGCILPNKSPNPCKIARKQSVPITQAVERAIRTIAIICGWVVLFRVISTFLQHWFLWFLPREVQVTVMGVLELANGCCALFELPTQGMRFVLAAFLLGIGGVCVAMQTLAVTNAVDTRLYFPGKVMQSLVSVILADTAQSVLFPPEERMSIHLWIYAIVVIVGIFLFFIVKKQNNSRNSVAVCV